MKKPNRQKIIYQIALSGISAGLALLLIWLSVIVRYGTIGFYIAACLAILVPLTNRYYFASICAYIASSLLAFAVVGDILAISGYVVYFAPMSIMMAIMADKNVKLYISIPIKVVFINLALAFMYFVAGTVFVSADVVGAFPYWAVAIVGTVILIALDFFMQYVYKTLKPVVSKALRKQLIDNDKNDDEEDINPFDDASPNSGDENAKVHQSEINKKDDVNPFDDASPNIGDENAKLPQSDINGKEEKENK